jgi:hypothetical protein
MNRLQINKGKGTGKGIALQAWTDPEGSGVLSSKISRQSAHKFGKAVSPTHRPHLPPSNYSWYSFLLGVSMKNARDTIGNRTRDLPTCSAVPQPTAPPRTPFK